MTNNWINLDASRTIKKKFKSSRLIQEMKFEQKKTMIGQLLDFTIKMFASQSSSSDNAKLVTILSDGRGIFSEGIETVTTAVRKAKLLNIFLVFIIVDNPLNKVNKKICIILYNYVLFCFYYIFFFLGFNT